MVETYSISAIQIARQMEGALSLLGASGRRHGGREVPAVAGCPSDVSHPRYCGVSRHGAVFPMEHPSSLLGIPEGHNLPPHHTYNEQRLLKRALLGKGPVFGQRHPRYLRRAHGIPVPRLSEEGSRYPRAQTCGSPVEADPDIGSSCFALGLTGKTDPWRKDL